MKINLPLRLAFLFGLILSTYSCVRDVDFEQTEQIAITPDVDLDLTFFQLTTSNFVDSQSGALIPIVRDTTRLEFLDDDFVRDNLKQIDLLLKYDNTFSQTLTHKTLFLDENDVLQYEISFDIDGSLDGETTTTTFEQTIIDPELEGIRNSIKMLIEITMRTDQNPIEGQLQHLSKAVYALEFQDL